MVIGVNFADLGEQFDWDRFSIGLRKLVVNEFPAHWREIQFECGRYLVAPYGWYAAEVLDVKRNHGENYAICAAIPTTSGSQLPGSTATRLPWCRSTTGSCHIPGRR